MGFRLNQRDAKRMMDKLGLDMKEVPNVKEVIIRTEGKDILIKKPSVSQVSAQGMQIYQIMGGSIEEQGVAKKYSEEDVLLVAQQAGVTKVVAEEALKECDGDLARAILKLSSK
ncbi:MAG: nascent polypeptide-associated complex protein [Nitrososphaeria archaeon]